jgi:dihydropteroate synthase
MRKYYTRACNFYYGKTSREKIKKKIALPLCGNKDICFSKVEIFTRNKKKINSRIINIKNIKHQSLTLKKELNKDLIKITSKRNFFSNQTIMGILNMTPDSFSDGGQYNKTSKALKHINLMINSGAEIIDIGGESTRPGSKTILPEEEWKRISQVVKIFKKKFPKIKLSVDTRKSDVIKNALRYKVDMINDVSSFSHDTRSLKTIEKFNIIKVLHHMQGTPQTMQINPKYKNVLLDIYDFFEENIAKNFTGKKFSKSIVLDPGIGFGKNLKHNLMLMSKISLFHSLGFPILIGTSRKRFISQISGKFDTKERFGGTLSSVLFTLSQGVQIFRVHNVKEVKQGILVYKELLNQ